jgi:hypothetical protein
MPIEIGIYSSNSGVVVDYQSGAYFPEKEENSINTLYYF